MERNYLAPQIEILAVSTEDVISTSLTIELPWIPFEEEGKEI